MASPRYKLKKMIAELEKMRGRHTELISVYIPAGYSLNDIMTLLANEVSLTQNVKSKTVRKNVTSALTKIQQHLKIYKKTPDNGLVIFCGNISEKEGVADIQLWAIEPPEPVKIKLYWCDQVFELGPLKEQVSEKEIYGLVVLDNSEATVGLLRGKSIEVLKHVDSIVPGKTSKGGQSAARYGRIREGLKHDFYKIVGDLVKGEFSKDVIGIIIAGPGPVKHDFYEGDFISTELKNKVLGVVDTGYADEHGLHEAVMRGQGFLKEASVSKERVLLEKFFTELKKDSGMVVYGMMQTLEALKRGAIDMLLVSEDSDWIGVEIECSCGFAEKKVVKKDEKEKQICPKCSKTMRVLGEKDLFETLDDYAKEYGSSIELISRETQEGEQFFQLGGIGGILRYAST